jgi:hypothetical protein
MFCISCAKLANRSDNRICIRCNRTININISCICDGCSNEQKLCSVCLKKINLTPDGKLLVAQKRGCKSCGRNK